jgi:hypothetical protein
VPGYGPQCVVALDEYSLPSVRVSVREALPPYSGGGNSLLKAPSNPFKAAELLRTPPGALSICGRSEQLFQQLPMSSKIYAALGAIDDETYILGLRPTQGPARAFALM